LADALATLLVQEGAVTLEDLARAQAVQREQGGSLDTALLELGLLGEKTLVEALARASGLPAAPAGALDEPDPRSRRVFPAKVAERHGLAPFRLEGKELHLLATWPVDVAALDEISFMLSLHLVPHVAAEWRVWELRRRVYDVALPERFVALEARRARAGGEPAPEEAGPVAAAPRVPESATPEPVGPGPAEAGEPLPLAAWGADPVAGEAASPPFAAGPTGPALPHPSPAAEPLARALAQAVELAEAAVGDEPLPVGLPAALPEQRVRPARWTLAEARQALAEAATRDQAVSALLRYALDFFEHAALLASARGRLHGRDALGADPGARARARGVSLPWGDAGIVRAVVETGGPYLGPAGPDAVVEALVAGLGRSPPRTMLLYPVQVRDRVVCLLYADNGEAPVSPRRVGDLFLLASEVGATLLRLLAADKASAPPAPPPEPGRPEEPAELTWGALPSPPEPEAPTGLPPLELDLLPAAEAAAPRPLAALEPTAAVAGEPRSLAAGPVPPDPTPPPVEPAPSVPDPALPVPEAARAAPAAGPDEERAAPPPQTPAAEPVPFGDAREAFTPPPAFDAVLAVKQLEVTRRGSNERARLLAQLALHGPESAAALAAALPGPVAARGPGGEEALPVAERGPVLEALCVLDIVATPYLVAVLADPDPRRRRYAALVLGQVGDPAAFLPLADRVFDADPASASAALSALAGLRGHPDFRPVLERLRRALHGEAPRPALAAWALVRLGDGGAVGPLIGLLEGAPSTVAAAAEALESLTARRLGRDPAAWSAWWQAHRGQRRTDWLFEALADADREVRIAAAEALRALGPSPVRFFADAPEPERRRSAGDWREWFESHGLEA